SLDAGAWKPRDPKYLKLNGFARARQRRRSGLADHVDTCRRAVGERARGEARVAGPALEADHGPLPHGVDQLHPRQLVAFEAQPGAAETAVLDLRLQAQPFQAVARGFLGQGIATLQPGRIDQCRKRTVRLLGALRTDTDLLQVGLVDPHAVAVGDDQLRVGRGVLPPEQVGYRQLHRAGGGFPQAAVRVVHLLAEAAIQALEVV